MTYVRLTTFQGEPGAHEEALHFVQEGALPMARKQQGFLGMRLFANVETGKVIVETLWDSHGSAEAAWTAMSRSRAHGAQAVGAFDPTTEVFELRLDENV